MATDSTKPYLKYALFCRGTEEGPGKELNLKEVIDLIELPGPSSAQEPEETAASGRRVLAELDLHLAFCIAEAPPGPHHLLVAIKAPGVRLDLPPPQLIEWEEGILFQRWIKIFRIPVQAPGRHSAAILLDGNPLGEASFLVRFEEG